MITETETRRSAGSFSKLTPAQEHPKVESESERQPLREIKKMHIVRRTLNLVRGFILSYGPEPVKKAVWDKEFSSDKWNFIDDTSNDYVYPHLERYARGGDILDLGCGPGNTANELAENAYRTYVGVDISQSALAKGLKRTNECGRAGKNSFVRSDFLNYVPSHDFDVILFRESLYHVPYGKVLELLEKYSKYLKSTGVFMVRLYLGDNWTTRVKVRVKKKIDLINSEFEILESHQYETRGKPTILVFRPQRQS